MNSDQAWGVVTTGELGFDFRWGPGVFSIHSSRPSPCLNQSPVHRCHGSFAVKLTAHHHLVFEGKSSTRRQGSMLVVVSIRYFQISNASLKLCL